MQKRDRSEATGFHNGRRFSDDRVDTSFLIGFRNDLDILGLETLLDSSGHDWALFICRFQLVFLFIWSKTKKNTSRTGSLFFLHHQGKFKSSVFNFGEFSDRFQDHRVIGRGLMCISKKFGAASLFVSWAIESDANGDHRSSFVLRLDRRSRQVD